MAREDGSNPLMTSQHWDKMNEAKMMLEEYYGYYEIHGHSIKNEKGEFILDDEGRPLWQEDERIWHDGIITQLANQAQFNEEKKRIGIKFIEDRTFANFRKERDPEAYQACVNYANADNLFSSQKNSLLLFGGVGSGKTHLAAAITNVFADKGLSISFDTFIEHLGMIRSQFNTEEEDKHLRDMKNAMLLVIDDLGQEKQTEWSKQVLFEVVNFRYAHKLPIVITTNLSEDGLANYVDEAIISRLHQMCVSVHMKAEDYRMEH